MKTRLTALLLSASLFLLLFAGCASNAPASDTTDATAPDSTPVASTPETDPKTTQPDAEKPVQSETTTGELTRKEAVAIALEAASLTEGDVVHIWSEYEIDDGIPEFEVEFRTADTEYDFTIHAETGAILSRDQEVEHITQSGDTTVTTSTPLTEAEVIAIALADANLSEADVMNLHVEYDTEDGDYEVEFYYNRMEYTYEISAATGTILDHEIDD